MPLRILVADDHDVVRQGVRLILRRQTDWLICGEAENGLEALAKEKELKPDLIILDISMPNKDGLEVAAELRKRSSAAKVLVLTMHDSRELTAAVKAAGAKGYVVKSHAARDLAKAIQTIVDGGDFFSGPLPAKPDTPEKPKKKFPLFCLDRVPAFS
jgi:two-component system nitrate/nitrite response regulator NarL